MAEFDPLFDEDPDLPFVRQHALASLVRQQPALAAPSSGVDSPRTTAAYAKTGGVVPPGTSADTYARIQARLGVRPETQPLIDYAKQRQDRSKMDMLMGLALSAKGGESLAPTGGHILQQALKESKDYEIPGGWGTVTDQGVVWNPEKLQESEIAKLTSIYGMQLKAEQAKEIADLRAGSKSPHPLQHLATTPGGETVSYDPNTGQNVIMRDGKAMPYTGPVMSQASLDKQAEVAQKAISSVNRMEYLVGRVKSNPRAFGGLSSLAPYTGSWAGTRLVAKQLSPQEQQVRGEVLREAASLVNELYGAALSAGEATRAGGFVPDAGDPPDVVMNKLHAGINWAKMKSQEHGSGVLSAAQARQSYGQQPAAPQQTPGRGTADSPIRVTPRGAGAAPQRDNAIEVPY
jgi:hypothetical protein